MTLKEIRKKQIELGFDKMQNIIDTGSVWHMQGSMGRDAMSLLESGACMLPTKPRKDAYGNVVPSRTQLMNGTKGTLLNSIRFYENI